MPQSVSTNASLDVFSVVKEILETIERDREREIISRRFGLYDRRETLEQIGELLGITRERVRQLEKAILTKLQGQSGELPGLFSAQGVLIDHLEKSGGASRIDHIADKLQSNADDRTQAHIAFVSTLSPNLIVIDENDYYHHSVSIASLGAEKVRSHINDLVAAVKKHGKPARIEHFAEMLAFENAEYTKALAHISKQLTELKNVWGHIKWPTVNPKNIRDKIYVVLKDTKEPMHFSEIADAIQKSDFKRKDVTIQAIHNELIKDKRFVLIGRGIYALQEWGYKKGTVADIIEEVLRESNEPLHRDEIVRRVLEKRQVKETTIMLNLQGKPQFKRVAKATYTLGE